MAFTFQPDVVDRRCTTTTLGGGDPAAAGVDASTAAIDIPIFPAPTTAIFVLRIR
jgi:hypothetical protein